MGTKEYKFCCNCKYHLRDEMLDRCTHPRADADINLVTGKMQLALCQVERNLNCGVDAKHFEPKSTESYEKHKIFFDWFFGK